jgi:aminotransferase
MRTGNTEGQRTDYVAAQVRDIPRSGIRDFFEIVQSMSDVISLGIGEPDFVTPWHIREAAIYALERGKTGYTSNLGAPDLRREISRYIHGHFKLEYDPQSEILVAVGVSEALDLALRALIDPGDEVIYHQPCYVSYAPGIRLAHGIPVPVATLGEDDFTLRAEALAEVITPRTKVVILNFPTNPTGAVLPREEQQKIADLCIEHDLLVITDEIYSELTYEGSVETIASLPGMRERTILLHGVSKAFAMTGFRIGFACAPPDFVEAMMRIHQYSMLCAPILSQEAAREALRNGAGPMMEMREQYRQRRNFLHKRLSALGMEAHCPKGSFYLFPSVRKFGLGSREFSIRLLEEQKVALVPGDAFGPDGEGYVRCSFATAMDQLELAVDKIETFTASL